VQALYRTWGGRALGGACAAAAALGLLTLALAPSGRAQDKAPSTPPPTPMTDGSTPPAGPAVGGEAPTAPGARLDAVPVPTAGPPFPLGAPSTRSSSQEWLRGQGIEQLVEHLSALRIKRAELDRQERDAVAALKEKLREQENKLLRLGIRLEDTRSVPQPAPPLDSPPAR
jgi:hypothetical protein